MNSPNIIHNGGLANKFQFMGSSTAEVISRPTLVQGGWNNNRASTINSEMPWHNHGGFAGDSERNSGILAFARNTGANLNAYSHRTILSGY